MKAILEVVKFNVNDVVTTSGNGGAPVCPVQTTETCAIAGITSA